MSAKAAAPSGPMVGVRVLDLTRWFAGPLATSWFGDLGADVIKVEEPVEGDPTRQVDHVFPGDLSSYFLGLNRSKRSVVLDMATDDGVEAIKRLARLSDVVVENFRPGVMDRLGLGYDVLSQENDRLIYCSISSFGASGPLARKPAMDLIVQAMGGVMGLTGPTGGAPIRVGAPVADYVGSMQCVACVSLALVERAQSGRGQKVDAILMEGQMGMLSNYIPGYFVTGQPKGPVGDFHPQLAPYQVYDVADGRIIVACLTEKFWRSLCSVVDRSEWITDLRFAANADRVRNRTELNSQLAPLIAAMSTQELTDALDAADVPCAPIMSIQDLCDSPQVIANASLAELEHPTAGTYKIASTPFRFARTPGRVQSSAPDLGADSAAVFGELGYSDEEIRLLTAPAE